LCNEGNIFEASPSLVVGHSIWRRLGASYWEQASLAGSCGPLDSLQAPAHQQKPAVNFFHNTASREEKKKILGPWQSVTPLVTPEDSAKWCL